jgi:dihydrofolate reductase
MRKLKLQVQISLDGYIADVNGKTDWLIWNWGPVWTWDDHLKKFFNDLTNTVDCVLLSRKMAVGGFIHHWERIGSNPNDPQFTFARDISHSHKIIFSKTLNKSVWPNASIASGETVSEVEHLKKQEGGDMIVYGGASFLSSLIQSDLIDEYYLFVNPVVLGNGLKIFEKKRPFKLLEFHSFPCGIVVLKYGSIR